MVVDSSDYVYKVNGVPLYYNFSGLSYYYHHPYESPPYDDTKATLMTSKIIQTADLLPITPPLSPNISLGTSTNVNDQSRRRSSVIMKVENCQILPANETQISIEHVCRWESCYK